MQYTPSFDNIGDIIIFLVQRQGLFGSISKPYNKSIEYFDYNFIFSYVLHKSVLRTNRADVIHTHLRSMMDYIYHR